MSEHQTNNQASEPHGKEVAGNKPDDKNTETRNKEENSSKRKDGAVLGELNGEATKETKETK